MATTSTLTIVANKSVPRDPLGENLPNRGRIRKFINNLVGLIGGQAVAPTTVLTGLNHATGTVIYGSATGTATITINGVVVAVSVGADDPATAALSAAAINASSDALVQYQVRASNLAGTVTASTAVEGNWVEICGVRLTARKAATGMQVNEFSCATSNNATATSLAAYINAHPTLRDIVYATASSAVVTVRARYVSASMPSIALKSSGSTLAVSSNVLTSNAGVCITAIQKGVGGNTMTLTAGATGGTATASAARLAGGTQTVVSL